MNTLRQRFEAKFIPEPMSGCWLWIGCVAVKTGYGQMRGADGTTAYAHHVSWELHCGPVPDGLQVLHRCDIRCCVNPGHLFFGTHQDNMADMWAKGRAKPWPNARKLHGEQHPEAKLTEDDVRYIRASKPRTPGLAQRFGVSYQTICDIRHGRSWRRVA